MPDVVSRVCCRGSAGASAAFDEGDMGGRRARVLEESAKVVDGGRRVRVLVLGAGRRRDVRASTGEGAEAGAGRTQRGSLEGVRATTDDGAGGRGRVGGVGAISSRD